MSFQSSLERDSPRNTVRFDEFELDLQTAELRKHGIKIKLAEQPFRVLAALLSRPGELVSREELQQLIWPGTAVGDFEQGLNRAVSKLRDCLTDRAVNSRFIETLPGRGYRFVGVIKLPPAQAQPKTRFPRIAVLGFGLTAVVVLLGLLVYYLLPPSLPQAHWRKLTTDNYVKIPPALSDGTRIYFAASYDGEQFIAQVPIAGGHPARLPITPPGPAFVLFRSLRGRTRVLAERGRQSCPVSSFSSVDAAHR